MTRAARIYVTATKSSNFAIRSPVFSREKSMPTVITMTTVMATGQEMTELILMPTTTEKAEMQLHAGSTMERINGKIVPTTGNTRTVAMTIPEVTPKLPILLSKTPVQEGELKEKSKVKRNQQSTNGSPMVHFDNDCEAHNSHASRGELMEIVVKTDNKAQNLHPITIITLLDNDQKRVACKALHAVQSIYLRIINLPRYSLG